MERRPHRRPDRAAQGTVTLNANGSFTFTPAPNFNGAATFTYKANDGQADSNVATATITVNVSAPLTTVVLQGGTAGYAGAADTYLYSFAATTPFACAWPTFLPSKVT